MNVQDRALIYVVGIMALLMVGMTVIIAIGAPAPTPPTPAAVAPNAAPVVTELRVDQADQLIWSDKVVRLVYSVDRVVITLADGTQGKVRVGFDRFHTAWGSDALVQSALLYNRSRSTGRQIEVTFDPRGQD